MIFSNFLEFEACVLSRFLYVEAYLVGAWRTGGREGSRACTMDTYHMKSEFVHISCNKTDNISM